MKSSSPPAPPGRSRPDERAIDPLDLRDPAPAEVFAAFPKTFAARRKETLPAWAPASRFDDFYRLAVNTRIAGTEAGKTIKVGDEVKIIRTRRIE